MHLNPAFLYPLLWLIRDVNQLIVREKNRDALIEAACQTLVRSRGLLGAWILLEESDAGTWTQAQSGLPDTAYELAVAELEKGGGPSCYRKVEAMAGEVLILRPGQECECCPLSTGGHVGVSLVVNLIHESRRFGVLCVSVPESYAEDETEQELLREIANDLAMALYGIEMESRRRAAEESLRGERQRMQMIIEGGGLGTWVWNLHTNETFLNEQWAHSLGYTLEELSPTTYETWVEVVHPEDLPLVQERLDLCLAGENPEYECELRLRHKQGHWIWILDRGRVLERDAEGKPETMFGTHTDITEIKNAEAELVQTKHLLTESQRVAGIGSWQWDLASDTTLWSEGMYAVFGLEKSTVARVDNSRRS